MLGSTIFASKYPQFKNPTSVLYPMLPRPYEKCRAKGIGQRSMKRKWFRHLLFDLDVCCRLHVHHLLNVYTLNDDLEKVEEMKSVIDLMNYSEKAVLQTLRLCNTLFTVMVIVRKCNEINNGRPPHLDEDDNISCIITLGSPNNGGDAY